MNVSSSRRDFLKLTATAAVGGGFLLGFALPARSEVRDTLTTNAPLAPNAWTKSVIRTAGSAKPMFGPPSHECWISGHGPVSVTDGVFH